MNKSGLRPSEEHAPVVPDGLLASGPDRASAYDALLLAAAQDALVVLDAAGRVLRAGAAFVHWCGVPPAAIEGQPLTEIAGGMWDVPALHALLADLPPDAAPREADLRLTLPGRGARVLHARAQRRSEPAVVVLALTDVTEQTTAQTHEAHLRQLFEATEEGFCIFEMLFDAAGRPVDYRFLEVNAAFAALTGLHDAVGQTARTLVPDLEDHWVETYGRVALTGVAERFESGSGAMGRWFAVEAVRVGGAESRRVALLFRNITAQRAAEDALRSLTETLEQQVTARTRQVQDLALRLTRAEQEERRRISQVLHDDLQQQLVAVQMTLHFVRKAADQGDHRKLFDNLNQAEDWLRTGIRITRDLTVDLSPPVAKTQGLAETLGWLVSQMQDLHGLEVHLTAEESFRTPDDDLRVLLFQIVRELLFNVRKHAGVTEAFVEIRRAGLHPLGSLVEICVTDHGQGFDVDGLDDQAAGFGLFSVRERLGLFGGAMTIDAKPSRGTCITLSVPLRVEEG